jgi:hypothetical protein
MRWLDSNQLFQSEVSALFTTDKLVSRGTFDAAGSILSRRNPRLHHLEFKTLLRFRMTKASERLETKTPPEHRLGGVRTTNTWNGISPFRLREKARARDRNRAAARVASAL